MTVTRDLQRDLSSAARSAVAHGHAVMQSGGLSPVALSQLVATLGERMFTPGEAPHPDDDYVFVVSNRGRRTPPTSVFHSDTSYVEQPPSFTALCAVDIPDHGGETVFVNQFDAWDAADAALQADLVDVEFLHVASRVANPDEAGEGAWHPVVRRHPTHGRVALYVSARERLVAARRQGRPLGEEEAVDLIDRAHTQAVKGAPLHRHRWQAGDLLLTDNRSTLHAADHSAVSGLRTLHRVMVRGERPVSAR